MPFQLGTDEAGYGPNLGPLTICGTNWHTGDLKCDIYKQLNSAISADVQPELIPICDSKKIYSSSGGITKLETAVLAILTSFYGATPSSANELLELLQTSKANCDSSFWRFIERESVITPIAADAAKIKELSELFTKECEQAGIELRAICCKVIFPDQFNGFLENYQNKAELLSAETLDCVRELSSGLGEPVYVVCDKHGGRSKYSGMLGQYLTDEFVNIDCESRAVSGYHWTQQGQTFEINFRSQGESFCATALSSMIAKYVRELCMESWNRYWAAEIPGIKPTKGYPMDAKRFKGDIAKKQVSLGIADDEIWRRR